MKPKKPRKRRVTFSEKVVRPEPAKPKPRKPTAKIKFLRESGGEYLDSPKPRQRK